MYGISSLSKHQLKYEIAVLFCCFFPLHSKTYWGEHRINLSRSAAETEYIVRVYHHKCFFFIFRMFFRMSAVCRLKCRRNQKEEMALFPSYMLLVRIKLKINHRLNKKGSTHILCINLNVFFCVSSMRRCRLGSIELLIRRCCSKFREKLLKSFSF